MPESNEAQIRAIIDRRVASIRAKDATALEMELAGDAVLFDLLPPLQRDGAGVAAKIGEWLESYDGEIGYDVRDLVVEAGDGIAYCRYLYHVSGTLKDGAEVSMWARSTICFRRNGNDWTIAHEHTSVPFDAETGKGRPDLTP